MIVKISHTDEENVPGFYFSSIPCLKQLVRIKRDLLALLHVMNFGVLFQSGKLLCSN